MRAGPGDESPDAPAMVYIDLHLVHEVTSPQAFTGLRARGLREDQIEWFMRKGYAWCRYLRDALA